MKVFYTSFLFISLLFLFSVCQTLQVYHGREDVDFALESIKYWNKRYEMYSFMFILFICLFVKKKISKFSVVKLNHCEVKHFSSIILKTKSME